jgi:hypothetical protein
LLATVDDDRVRDEHATPGLRDSIDEGPQLLAHARDVRGEENAGRDAPRALLSQGAKKLAKRRIVTAGAREDHHDPGAASARDLAPIGGVRMTGFRAHEPLPPVAGVSA